MAANFSDTTPAAPSGHTNVAFQSDTAGNISGNIPTPVDAGTQAANKVLAGPTTGSAATPAFRLLVAADIPNIAESQVTSLATDLAAKAPLASPTFTGTPSAPPPSTADSSTKLATTAYVQAQGFGTSSGTVTSVALTVPSWLSVAGSPVTTSGTLAVTATTGQTANLFLATPNGSTGAASLRAIVQADLPAQPVDIPCSFIGKPGAGATTLLFAVTRSLTIPANFSGAIGLIDPVNGANPTATAVFTIKKVSSGTLTTLGTASISTSGVYTFATTGGSAQSLASGDGLIGIAPSSQDATLSGPYFTIPVTR